MRKQVQLTVTGVVQGVFYRSETKAKAEALSLKGWVKNNHDNSVTIVCEGEEEDIYSLVDWCWEGPGSAQVDDIEEQWQEPEEFEGFSIKH